MSIYLGDLRKERKFRKILPTSLGLLKLHKSKQKLNNLRSMSQYYNTFKKYLKNIK